jgi:enterochelin esterase family protein
MMKVMQERMDAFEADMTQVLIPFIDKTFRTIPDRDRRAMAGFSMGGMQTFQVRFNHVDLFSYIGGFSGAAYVFTAGNEKLDTKTAYNGAMSDPAMFATVSICWGPGVGTDERTGPYEVRPRKTAYLPGRGEIRHVFYESPDTSHEWQTWRRDLKVFAPRLSRLGAKGHEGALEGPMSTLNFQLWWFEYCD